MAPIIDLVLGLIFIYFLLSIICSAIVEIVLSTFKIRGKVLGKWLLMIFNNKMLTPEGKIKKLGQAIMDHDATTALSNPGEATAFIDAKNFVSALIEKITYNPDPGLQKEDDPISKDGDFTLKTIKERLKKATGINGSPLLSIELQRTFLLFASEAEAEYFATDKNTGGALQLFREKMEAWFDTNMERVTGHLKIKYVRRLTFWIGIVLVVFTNADSISLAKYLYNNPDARAKIAAQAVTVANDTTWQKRVKQLSAKDSLNDKEIIDAVKANALIVQKGIATLDDSIPLGWGADSINCKVTFTKIVGWLATVFAIMLGAPFWFDLINKIANVRGTGAKPASSTDAKQPEKK